MSNFSAGLRIANIDDFLTPAQDCIIPVKVKSDKTKTSRIIIGDDGVYTGVTESGEHYKMEKVQITLDDCLACSGCITTAEEILIKEQSTETFIKKIAEIKDDPNTIIVVSLSPQSAASLATRFQLGRPSQAFDKLRNFFLSLGVSAVLDTTFGREFSLLETAKDLHRRITEDPQNCSQLLPLFSSTCPGWICFAEKDRKNKKLLPRISTARSPQQVMGFLLKRFLPEQYCRQFNQKQIYHATVMPCYDKKLEGSRPEFSVTAENDGERLRDVDVVISSLEIEDLIVQMQYEFTDKLTPQHEIERIMSCRLPGSESSVYRHPGSGSGGYLDFAMRYCALHLHNITLGPNLYNDQHIRIKRSGKNYEEIQLYANSNLCEIDQKPDAVFVYAYGLRNLQKIVDNVFRRKCSYQFVEMMACPGGCLNGGAQVPGSELVAVSTQYEAAPSTKPLVNPAVSHLYDLLTPHQISSGLHTAYNAVESLDLLHPSMTTF